MLQRDSKSSRKTVPGRKRADEQEPARSDPLIELARQAGNRTVTGALRDDHEVQAAESVHSALRSSGTPLTPVFRKEAESVFGADLSDVRVHTDSTAASSAAGVDAHAYTSGSHIVFGKGRYDASSTDGQRLLAHELTHVLQQRQAPVEGTVTSGRLRISHPSDRFEQEADRTSAAFVSPGAAVRAAQPRSTPAPPPPSSGAVQRKGKNKQSDKKEVAAPNRNKPEEATGYRATLKHDLQQQGLKPYIVKVAIGGSAYDAWATHTSSKGRLATGGQGADWIRQDQPKLFKKTGLTYYAKPDPKGINLAFAGPTSKETKGNKGRGFFARGSADTGSNSIAALVANVPSIIEDLVNNAAGPGHFDKVVVLMKAHSRGAVAGSRVAAALAHSHDQWDVELVMFDPVPGPEHDPGNQQDPNTTIDLSAVGLAKFALVYSVASGYNKGRMFGVGPQSKAWFTPQQVLGAQTIIISTQSHSAGLTAGFRYADPNTGVEKVYLGSRLNLLPPGIYVDRNKTGKNALRLAKVADRQQATQALASALQLREHAGEGIKGKSDKADDDRAKRIHDVLMKFADDAQWAP